jgi:hypothetical protein
VAAATLAADLKRFFRRAAREIGREDPKAATRFERASAHWLRHTHGSHAVAANVPIEVVQNNLGHASLSTTTIYVTSEKRRRYREMAKFLGGRVGEGFLRLHAWPAPRATPDPGEGARSVATSKLLSTAS